MAKLTKAQAKAHGQAVDLLKQETLSDDERIFVLDNFDPSANHINSAAGAFFTPLELARSFAIEVDGGRVVDLCAGIGALSYAVAEHCFLRGVDLVCIELNPDYVAVGRKVVPQATWICADALDAADLGLGRFDFAISNPPFGGVKRSKNGPRYRGRDFEFHLIDAASQIASYGAFIIPQMSAGFRYSDAPHYSRDAEGRARDFEAATNLLLESSCGIDTSFARDQWRGVAPAVEVVCVDFSDAGPASGQFELFAEAAE